MVEIVNKCVINNHLITDLIERITRKEWVCITFWLDYDYDYSIYCDEDSRLVFEDLYLVEEKEDYDYFLNYSNIGRIDVKYE